MYALTVKQPWAQAIAQFGKNVENRKARPPAALIGQRIAIHVSKTWGINEYGIQLPAEMLDWTCKELARKDPQKINAPPHAGRIIATARLVGWVAPQGLDVTAHEIENDAEGSLSRGERLKAWWANEDWRDAVTEAEQSPWLTGPVGWVLSDVVMLLDPVGNRPAWGCVACSAVGLDVQEGARCPQCNAKPGYLRRYDHTIRGQLGCWKVAPELAAQVHEQEQMARGRR